MSEAQGQHMLTMAVIFEPVIALGMAGVVTPDILRGQVDLGRGPFHAREAGSKAVTTLFAQWCQVGPAT